MIGLCGLAWWSKLVTIQSSADYKSAALPLSYWAKLVFALPRSSGLHGRAARKDDEKERGWSPVLVMTQENAFAPGDVRGYSPLVLRIVIVSTDALTLVP